MFGEYLIAVKVYKLVEASDWKILANADKQPKDYSRLSIESLWIFEGCSIEIAVIRGVIC